MNVLLMVAFLMINVSVFTQNTDTTEVKWMSVETVGELFAKKQKPILFFIYSETNDSSQMMLDSIFTKDEVANYINVLFYPVKISAQTKEDITFFDGTVYKYNTKKEVHDIIEFLTGGVPYYPTLVCFNKSAEGRVFQGYKNRDAIFPILTFYAEEIGNSVTYEEYYEYYIKAYPPGQSQSMTRVLVDWKTVEEALEAVKTNPKKIFIDITNNYKVSCTVMMLTTYNNPKIAEYLNKHFYPVRFNVFSNDTINAWANEFVNNTDEHPYHSLAVALLEGKMQFPVVLFFNKEGKFIHRQIAYMTPEKFEPWLYYIANDKFKETTFAEYLKTFESQMFKE